MTPRTAVGKTGDVIASSPSSSAAAVPGVSVAVATSSSSASAKPVPTISKRVETQILDRVEANRLTVIVGETGCGKSTQVPQLLLRHFCQKQHHRINSTAGTGAEPQNSFNNNKSSGPAILVTQPRRLAVVAVATYVARQVQERSDLILYDADRPPASGGDKTFPSSSVVGYQVGGENRTNSHTTKLIFSTAGILLEELRINGVEVLKRYKCIVIDECHERSPESDLVLAILKKLLTKHPNLQIRIVLMSATFHHGLYRTYFQSVPGCEHVDTVTLENAEVWSRDRERVQVRYTNDIIPLLLNRNRMTGESVASSGIVSMIKSWQATMRLQPSKDLEPGEGKSLREDLLGIILELIRYLDDEEEDHAAFLVFAPTYRHLEQLHELLEGEENDDEENHRNQGKSRFRLSVLHSSIDIEDCLRSMDVQRQQDEKQQIDHGGADCAKRRRSTITRPRRHILLASAIADSSVTIPGTLVVVWITM